MNYKLQYKITLWDESIDTSYYYSKNHVDFFLQMIKPLKDLKSYIYYKNLDIPKCIMKEIKITHNPATKR